VVGVVVGKNIRTIPEPKRHRDPHFNRISTQSPELCPAQKKPKSHQCAAVKPGKKKKKA
jgi:hypothetical protein